MDESSSGVARERERDDAVEPPAVRPRLEASADEMMGSEYDHADMELAVVHHHPGPPFYDEYTGEELPPEEVAAG